ncbi:hypothetical protein B566_EDAN004353 [Ephemera danica]|nr:hypothetical protein B566_EDAN004353 [Ephemera danica]
MNQRSSDVEVLLLTGLLATCSGFGFSFGGDSKKETPAPPPAPVPIVRSTNVSPASTTNEPQYTFRYVVQDARTGDYKSQEERRDGGHVRGTYSVAEPNGDLRVVSYSADGDSGFRAEVRVEPAGTIPISQSPEGRTFANFLSNPFNLFRTGSAYPTKPPVYERPVTRPVTNPPKPVYTNKPHNVYAEKSQMFERPIFISDRPVFTEQADDVPFVASFPQGFDRTRLPETPLIPMQPSAAYPYNVYFNKATMDPVQDKPEEHPVYRPHLLETPAIPITPSPSVATPQSDVITGKVPNIYPARFQMIRRPTSVTRPTSTTPMKITTPSVNFPPSPFQYMRYTPAVTAPVPQVQQKYWQNTAQFQYPGIPNYSNYGGQQYMLVRTYLVPIPPGGIPMQGEPLPTAATAFKSTPVNSSEPVPQETELLAMTTMQTESSEP